MNWFSDLVKRSIRNNKRENMSKKWLTRYNFQCAFSGKEEVRNGKYVEIDKVKEALSKPPASCCGDGGPCPLINICRDTVQLGDYYCQDAWYWIAKYLE
jgi:hypothetical protein